MSASTMELSVKRIHRLNNGGATVAFADVTINDALLVKGLRVVKGSNGLFVSMPQEKGRDDRWYDTVVCLSDSFKSELSRCVLEAYQAGE
ncbi:MAG: SpoVG family protein [Candidatus Omnitrophota bacterium]